MFGFFVGTACLIGLFVTMKRHRYGGRCRGRRFAGAHLFDELGLNEEQERAVRQRMRHFRDKVRPLRDEKERLARDLATAIRSEHFDENVLGETFVRHDDLLRELRLEFVEMMAHVHEALDQRTREKLAALLESGRIQRMTGPYR